MKTWNIQRISEQNLCIGCGTCKVACPEDAIDVHLNEKGFFEAVVNNSRCIDCRLCLSVCPSNIIDFKAMNIFAFGEEASDSLIGNHVNLYMGHAKDDTLHGKGQSGGLVTALLVFSIESGLIDGAVVTRMKKNGAKLLPEVLVAKTKEELLSATGSKYCPAPVNAKLKDLLKAKGKYAVVALPCQMYGIRKLESLCGMRNVLLHMGLFCSHVLSLKLINFLSYKAGFQESEVVEFDYRSKEWRGWPGDIRIGLANRKPGFLSRDQRIVMKNFFTHLRCKMCRDHTNELADMSVGDAWLPEVMGSRKGESISIVRNDRAEQLIKSAKKDGIVEIEQLSRESLMRAQKLSIVGKRNWCDAQVHTARLFRKPSPSYCGILEKPTRIRILQTMCDWAASRVPDWRPTYSLLKNVPLPILKAYGKAISYKRAR